MHELQGAPPQRDPDESPPDPLREKLHSWLNDQGYPLELRTARAFQGRGRVQQSDYYYDTDAQCYREIDVRVTLQADSENLLSWLEVALCIEAKSAPDKPWVLFSGEEQPLHPIAAALQRISSPAARDWLGAAALRRSVQNLPLLRVEDHPGHNLIRASLGPNQREDVAYKATLSAVKAAHWTAKEASENPDERVSLVAFPVVVIDAPLFKCSLDSSSGELKLWRVDCGTLVWRNSVTPANQGHTIVHVVTEPAIQGFADNASQTLEGLGAAYRKHEGRKKGKRK
ncbi:hypothetical protein [Micromonospora chalcea]|uniref:hypothetical protein n=1 Tax=Micromonospora chalcea TaxID=1874 RepID=UPI0011B0E5A9|nr:hypothetical protein [Micromonospora chalcea]